MDSTWLPDVPGGVFQNGLDVTENWRVLLTEDGDELKFDFLQDASHHNFSDDQLFIVSVCPFTLFYTSSEVAYTHMLPR